MSASIRTAHFIHEAHPHRDLLAFGAKHGKVVRSSRLLLNWELLLWMLLLVLHRQL
jgi:hypothetical protein